MRWIRRSDVWLMVKVVDAGSWGIRPARSQRIIVAVVDLRSVYDTPESADPPAPYLYIPTDLLPSTSHPT